MLRRFQVASWGRLAWRRVAVLTDTDTGFAAMRAARPVYAGCIVAHFARLLSPEEALALIGLLRRMLDAKREPLPVPRL